MEIEYKPGDVVPVFSPLYRVMHDLPKELKTFYADDLFPPCPKCGEKVRYLLPSRVLRDRAARRIAPKPSQ